MSEQDKTTKERGKLLAPEKKSNKKKNLLISKDKNDNKTSNENDELLVFEDQNNNKISNEDNEDLMAENQNDDKILNEDNKDLMAENQNDGEIPNEDNEDLMAENQNDDKILNEEALPLVSKKKKIIRILIGVAIVGVCAVGINKYIDHRHEVFLQEHAKAITDIKNKNIKGYEAAFEILQDLADDGEATASDYYYLGYLYQYGFGTQKNYSNAYKYYKKSNTAKAYYQTAILYKLGQGVNKDNKKAIEYYKKSYKAGYKTAIVGLATFLESNPNLISTTDPELIYQIYLAYKSNKITERKSGEKDKYLSIAVSRGYEPAIIEKAKILEKNKDYYNAIMLWQTLLYSSDPKIADLAEKEMAKIEALIKEQREKELEEKTSKKEIVEEKPRSKPEPKDEKAMQKLIEANRKIGLTIPKQKLNNLDGLIYINLLNTDKEKLQNFYRNTSGIEIEKGWIINSKNTKDSYINKLINLSKFKNNRSSLKIDFGDNNNTNKYEGLIYYFYNNKNELIQNMINTIIQNKPKPSSLIPRLNNESLSVDESSNKNIKGNLEIKQESILDQITETEQLNKEQKQDQQQSNIDQEKQQKKGVTLTYKEKIQRMEVFAQKGDYRELYKLENAASNGDVYAIYYTGVYYYNLKDYKKAMGYFEEAASKNYGPAYYKLGNMYYDEQENGVSYDKQKAMMYYKKAASLGVKNAEHILMLMN